MTEKPIFQTVKTSLKSIIRNDRQQQDEVVRKIALATKMTSRIMTHTLLFLKLYFLYTSAEERGGGKVNRTWVAQEMKNMSGGRIGRNPSGRPPNDDAVALKTTLDTFYEDHWNTIR